MGNDQTEPYERADNSELVKSLIVLLMWRMLHCYLEFNTKFGEVLTVDHAYVVRQPEETKGCLSSMVTS